MKTLKYSAKYLNDNFVPDAIWNKKEWSMANTLTLNNKIINDPVFVPKTEVKMMYNEEYIYVIFKVEDKYVRSVLTEINSPVSNDSCVEFFFSPEPTGLNGYFNLEINAGGTSLMRFQKRYNIDKIPMDIEDIENIEIAHSLPKIVDPEIIQSTTWVIEYRISLKMLNKYYKITMPAKGIRWYGNFYKIGNETSNPHYLTWNKIEDDDPHFHLPEYFGIIEFI